MSISEKANDLLNKFGSAQFDFMVWNTPDNLVARDKARQEISDYIAELEAAQRWHVVDDGDLPIVGKSIMFYDSSSEEIYRGVYTASHHWRANYFSEKCGTVTHWMPMPQLPEVQE